MITKITTSDAPTENLPDFHPQKVLRDWGMACSHQLGDRTFLQWRSPRPPPWRLSPGVVFHGDEDALTKVLLNAPALDDPIVIGHRDHPELWGQLLGDTADRTADHAHCSEFSVAGRVAVVSEGSRREAVQEGRDV